MHQHRDAGHDDQHDHRQRIYAEVNRVLQVAEGEPVLEMNVVALLLQGRVTDELDEDQD